MTIPGFDIGRGGVSACAMLGIGDGVACCFGGDGMRPFTIPCWLRIAMPDDGCEGGSMGPCCGGWFRFTLCTYPWDTNDGFGGDMDGRAADGSFIADPGRWCTHCVWRLEGNLRDMLPFCSGIALLKDVPCGARCM